MRTVLLLLFTIYSFAQGTSDSSSALVYLCDALSPRYGCEPQYWTDGNRLKCKNTTQIMAWASKPERSDCYEIVAGTEEDKPVTSYRPDEILMIHVRVKCYGMLFRGIQMYAVNGSEAKVGDWEISSEEPINFRRPWESADDECFGTIMHASAEYKPYHSVLYFKTPSAGTGKITFRALIKYGNANTGAFYWPAKDLVLTEQSVDTTPQPSYFKLSAPGQSCDELCAQTEGYSCSEEALSVLQNPSYFSNKLTPEAVCVMPLLSACGAQAATYDPVNQFCYYPSTNCSERGNITNTCSTKLSGISRLCGCVSKTATTFGPNPTEDDEMDSSASVTRGAGALLFFGLFLVNPRAAIALLLFLSVSTAHNWINSLSRSNGASTYRPFKPATTDMPHAQVGPNQSFEIEWMTAHGGYTYFVIVHSKNQGNISQHTAKLLEDYINLAPPGKRINATSGIYQKFHRKDTPTLDNDFTDNPNNTYKNYFLKFVNRTDPLWISRPAVFEGRVGSVGKPTDANNNTYQLQYKPADLANDCRVSYESAKYPWIEAVYKFRHNALQPVRPDVANFWIPGYGGYGRYLVQYLWSGYYDVMDVDYLSTQVEEKYGTKPNATRWRRIDHCLFDSPRAVYEATEIVTDANWCLRKCAARTSCWGVNVVPIQAPSTAYKFNKPANDVWFYPNIYGADIYVNWNLTIFNNTKAQLLNNPSEDKYMCFTVQPADFTDTTDEYTVSKDPDDPIFYSTCYYRYRGNTFSSYPDTTVPTVAAGPWRFNDKCVSCESQSFNAYPDVIPSWEVRETCINCDVEPESAEKPVLPATNLVESGVRCDGLSGSWSRASHNGNCTNTTCTKQLTPIGRSTSESLTTDECRALAARDPACSNTYMWVFNGTARCYCYLDNAPCCKSCSRRPDAMMNVYEINTTADPTCETGVKSADGKSCCSASCGADNCLPNAAIVNPVGFCCSTCITRSCSQYGPPCMLP